MSRVKWTALIAALLFGSCLGWYFYSPVYTLKQMKSAAQTNDSGRFSSYVDFPALRESMKSQIMAQMIAESKKRPGIGALGLALGSAFMGPVIDGLVSPDGVRAAFVARQHEPSQATGVFNQSNPVIQHRSLSEFAVTSKDHPKGAMIFRRDGLSWRLSGIELASSSQDMSQR